MVRTVIATNSFWLCKAQRTQRVIHSKSWSSWSTNSADNLEFSAERLSENAKTINLSTQEQQVLKFVTNKSQVLQKSPKYLIYISWFQIF